MKPWRKILLGVVALVVVVVGALLYLSYDAARGMLTNPPEDREPNAHTPADFGMAYEDVTVTSADGLNLVGWFIPPRMGRPLSSSTAWKATAPRCWTTPTSFTGTVTASC